jgi:signal transduction histidine kinase
MRPLDRLSSIKYKLGVVIVAAVAVTVVVVVLGVRAGLSPLACGVGAGLLALGMVQFLARGMTSPLREMSAAASAMATGDYGRRVTATSSDEVGQLAQAFNRMSAELEELDRMRRDLVANVSHELRTPISALQAVLENLVDGVEPPDPQTFATMLQQVERLGRLVTQLLDLSRLESGVMSLRITPFEVRGVFEQAVREARVHMRQKSATPVELDVDVQPDDLRIRGDAERVHQVVANLLDNAMRHSPAGGLVRLAASAADGRARVEVSDEGPGIPRSERTRVFERFYRSDAARSARDGGTGLGLAIVRWIVDLHGGDITVESGASTGCRMVVWLPRAPSH